MYFPQVDALGVGLGGVMVGMVVLFLVVVLKLGLDVKVYLFQVYIFSPSYIVTTLFFYKKLEYPHFW